VRSSQGVRKIKKKNSKEALLGRIFDLGVREEHTILVWGYAEVYDFDFGVRGYQKVENPLVTQIISMAVVTNTNVFLSI
jgi:hypothetical protein